MNKHNKQKSREIRAIMRTDKWGRMTYREARRYWQNGSRVIWFSPSGLWMNFDNSKLSLSYQAIKRFAVVYREVLKYANERCIELTYERSHFTDAIKLRLSGRKFDGQRFRGYILVRTCDLNYFCGEPEVLARYLIENFDHSLYCNGFYPPKPLHIREDPRQLRLIPPLDEWDNIRR